MVMDELKVSKTFSLFSIFSKVKCTVSHLYVYVHVR